MKTKFVKLAWQIAAETVAPAIAGPVVEGVAAGDLAAMNASMGGGSAKSPAAEVAEKAGVEAKKPQDNAYENMGDEGRKFRSLKDQFLANGFGSSEFDSYLPAVPNALGIKVQENPKAKIYGTSKMVQMMELALKSKTTTVDLKVIFNTIIDLANKSVDFGMVQQVIPEAAALDAQAPGVGIFQSIMNAIHGDISGTTMLMFLLSENQMNAYNNILARALGHKLSDVEKVIKSTDISKLSLEKATEELGIVRGIQVGIESQEINAIEENFTKTLTHYMRDVPFTREMMSLARKSMMLYHVYSNIKDQFLGSVVPSTVPRRSSYFENPLRKFVKLAQTNAVQFATSTPRNAPAANTPMGRPANPQSLSNALNNLNTPRSRDSNNLIRDLLAMNQAIIDGDNASFTRLSSSINTIIATAVTASANPKLIELANYWVGQFTSTGSQTALFDPTDIKETVQALTEDNKLAEQAALLSSKLKTAAENYDKRKSNLYGGGEEGVGKLTTDVMEFGQAKKVPYNTVQQNLQRLNEFKASVEDCINLANQLYQLYQYVKTLPPSTKYSAEQRASQLRAFDLKIISHKSQLEKWKSERVKVVSELATIKQTTKQKDIRFFNSDIARKMKLLSEREFGGYGMMGGAAQLNNLMAPLIKEQKDKIANITSEMNAATNPEDKRAFQGQLQLANNELQDLLAEGPNMLLNALEGKFDDTKFTGAYASVSRSKFIKTSKYNKEADERLEDYYNEEMDYSPYGTALEHPLENKGVLTEDIKPHKKSKYKKQKFHIK